MKRIAPALALLISGFFICNIVKHMVMPGENIGYTRMLLFACLGAIPVSLMMMIVGGPDSWPVLAGHARDAAGDRGPLYWLALAGLITATVILPVVLLAAAWYVLGLRSGLLFVLYFVPVAIRLLTAPAGECAVSGVIQALLFFAAMLIGVGIVSLLEKHSSAGVYARQVQGILPGYDYASSARMFFAAAVFALCNQLIEFGHAVAGLVKSR